MAPPSEFDLRAALAEGEGDAPNPNLVIVAGQARRAQRRSRILSTVAVVALVTGGAVGISQLGGGAGSDNGGTDSAAGAAVGGEQDRKAESQSNAVNYGAQSGDPHGGVAQAPRVAMHSLAATACPSFAAADSLVYDSAKSSQSVRAGRVFSASVSSAVVCAYGPTLQAASVDARTPARLELTGAPAAQLATSIETAPTTTSPGPCGQGAHNRYAFVAIGEFGQQVGTVTADLGAQCAAIVTNGAAVRYDWHPPPNLARRMVALTPRGLPMSPNPSPTR